MLRGPHVFERSHRQCFQLEEMDIFVYINKYDSKYVFTYKENVIQLSYRSKNSHYHVTK